MDEHGGDVDAHEVQNCYSEGRRALVGYLAS